MFTKSVFVVASTISKIITGLFLLKIVSVMYGTNALPILGQALSVNALIIGISGSGIGRSLIYLHKSSFDDSEKRKRLAKASSFMLVFLAVLILLTTSIAAERIALTTVDSSVLVPYLKVIGLLSLVISVSSLTMTYGAIENLQEHVALVLIVSQILAIFFVYIASKAYPSRPVYVFYPVIVAIIIVTSMTLFQRNILRTNLIFNVYQLFNIRSFQIEIKEILSYSFFIAASVIIIQITIMFMRAQLISNYGLAITGAWEGANKVSEGIVQLFGVAIAFVLLPEFVKQKNHNPILLVAIIFAIAIFGFTLIVTILLGEQILAFLYTSEVSSLTQRYLSIWLLGDGMKVCFYVFQYYRLAKHQMFSFLIFEVLAAILIILVSILASNSIFTFLMGYVTVYLFVAVLSFIYYRVQVKRLDDRPITSSVI